jgi:hypothetical protein
MAPSRLLRIICSFFDLFKRKISNLKWVIFTDFLLVYWQMPVIFKCWLTQGVFVLGICFLFITKQIDKVG